MNQLLLPLSGRIMARGIADPGCRRTLPWADILIHFRETVWPSRSLPTKLTAYTGALKARIGDVVRTGLSTFCGYFLLKSIL